jgi:hypothetical protein
VGENLLQDIIAKKKATVNLPPDNRELAVLKNSIHATVVWYPVSFKGISGLWSRTFIVVFISHTSICLPFKLMP